MNLAIAFVAILFFLAGCYFLILRKGRRRTGAVVMLVAFIAFGYAAIQNGEETARAAGFASLSDQTSARKIGITDAAAWSAMKAVDASRIAADEARKTEEANIQRAAIQAAAKDAKASEDEAARIAEVDRLAAEEAALAAAEAERVAAAEAAAHDQKYGFTCLSLWDGSHDGFVAAVKKTLNDPDSFEHDETKTWPVNAEGRNTILMNFRARNAFGGMIRVKASGSFDNKTCEAVRVDLIE